MGKKTKVPALTQESRRYSVGDVGIKLAMKYITTCT